MALADCLGCGRLPGVRVRIGADLYCRACAHVIAYYRKEQAAAREAIQRQRAALHWPARERGDPIGRPFASHPRKRTLDYRSKPRARHHHR
jgi:hypothetical protein